MSNLDLFNNPITPSAASPIKDAKIVSTPPPSYEPPDDVPPIDRPISEERLKIAANSVSVYESYLTGPNANSIATADLNFVDNFHDCKMSQSAIKTIRRATALICYITRKESFAAEKERIVNEKLTKCGCTSKRFADTQKKIRKNYKDIIAQARRNITGHYTDKGKWIDGKNLCTFITLTLPADQRHSDNEITEQLINPFFVWARKQKNVRYYIWKKELQANGNIHFHIIWDKAVNWNDIRCEWNKLCNKGYVDGIEQPFDYVDRYRSKWTKVHAKGFNREYVTEYVSTLPTTDIEFETQRDAWEAANGREMTLQEYDKLRQDVITGIVANYEKAYDKEMAKKEKYKQYVLWSDPNTTDIRAVKSPRAVAAYLSKYIAKDIDNNPALSQYNDQIQVYKDAMKQWRKEAESLRNRGEDYSFAIDLWQQNKDALDNFRRSHCPIKGRMWFKSQSLTVFLKGVPVTDSDGNRHYFNYENIDDDYIRELRDLEKYLLDQEKQINFERSARAADVAARGDAELAAKLKKPLHLVLERYEIPMSNSELARRTADAIANGDYSLSLRLQEPLLTAFDSLGTSLQKSDLAQAAAIIAAGGNDALAAKYVTPILSVIEQCSNLLCKTFVISIFDLQQMKTDTGRPRFPYLSLAWNRHIKDCLYYNRKNRFVDKKDEKKAAFVALADRATYSLDGIYPHTYSVYDMPFEYCKIESGKYNVTLPDADFYLHCDVPDHCAKGKAIAAFLKDAIRAAIRNRKDGITADGDIQRLHEYLLTINQNPI